MHWEYLECCRVHVEARVHGRRDQPAGCPGPEYQGQSEFKESARVTLIISGFSNNLDMTKLTPEKSGLVTLSMENGNTQIKI